MNLKKKLREATGLAEAGSPKKARAAPESPEIPDIPFESTSSASATNDADERILTTEPSMEEALTNPVNPGGSKQKRKLCEEPGCTVQPSYNFEGERSRKYCKKHKMDGMVLTASLVHPAPSSRAPRKVCEEEGCTIQPSYNFEGQRGRRYCKAHKLDMMVDVSNKLCENEGCPKQASCNFPGQKRKFCTQHKTDGMEDLVNKRCFEDVSLEI